MSLFRLHTSQLLFILLPLLVLLTSQLRACSAISCCNPGCAITVTEPTHFVGNCSTTKPMRLNFERNNTVVTITNATLRRLSIENAILSNVSIRIFSVSLTVVFLTNATLHGCHFLFDGASMEDVSAASGGNIFVSGSSVLEGVSFVIRRSNLSAHGINASGNVLFAGGSRVLSTSITLDQSALETTSSALACSFLGSGAHSIVNLTLEARSVTASAIGSSAAFVYAAGSLSESGNPTVYLSTSTFNGTGTAGFSRLVAWIAAAPSLSLTVESSHVYLQTEGTVTLLMLSHGASVEGASVRLFDLTVHGRGSQFDLVSGGTSAVPPGALMRVNVSGVCIGFTGNMPTSGHSSLFTVGDAMRNIYIAVENVTAVLHGINEFSGFLIRRATNVTVSCSGIALDVISSTTGFVDVFRAIHVSGLHILGAGWDISFYSPQASVAGFLVSGGMVADSSFDFSDVIVSIRGNYALLVYASGSDGTAFEHSSVTFTNTSGALNATDGAPSLVITTVARVTNTTIHLDGARIATRQVVDVGWCMFALRSESIAASNITVSGLNTTGEGDAVMSCMVSFRPTVNFFLIDNLFTFANSNIHLGSNSTIPYFIHPNGHGLIEGTHLHVSNSSVRISSVAQSVWFASHDTFLSEGLHVTIAHSAIELVSNQTVVFERYTSFAILARTLSIIHSNISIASLGGEAFFIDAHRGFLLVSASFISVVDSCVGVEAIAFAALVEASGSISNIIASSIHLLRSAVNISSSSDGGVLFLFSSMSLAGVIEVNGCEINITGEKNVRAASFNSVHVASLRLRRSTFHLFSASGSVSVIWSNEFLQRADSNMEVEDIVAVATAANRNLADSATVVLLQSGNLMNTTINMSSVQFSGDVGGVSCESLVPVIYFTGMINSSFSLSQSNFSIRSFGSSISFILISGEAAVNSTLALDGVALTLVLRDSTAVNQRCARTSLLWLWDGANMSSISVVLHTLALNVTGSWGQTSVFRGRVTSELHPESSIVLQDASITIMGSSYVDVFSLGLPQVAQGRLVVRHASVEVQRAEQFIVASLSTATGTQLEFLDLHLVSRYAERFALLHIPSAEERISKQRQWVVAENVTMNILTNDTAQGPDTLVHAAASAEGTLAFQRVLATFSSLPSEARRRGILVAGGSRDLLVELGNVHAMGLLAGSTSSNATLALNCTFADGKRVGPPYFDPAQSVLFQPTPQHHQAHFLCPLSETSSPSLTKSETLSISQSATLSGSTSRTPSGSSTASASHSRSGTGSITASRSATNSGSASLSGTASPSQLAPLSECVHAQVQVEAFTSESDALAREVDRRMHPDHEYITPALRSARNAREQIPVVSLEEGRVFLFLSLTNDTTAMWTKAAPEGISVECESSGECLADFRAALQGAPPRWQHRSPHLLTAAMGPLGPRALRRLLHDEVLTFRASILVTTCARFHSTDAAVAHLGLTATINTELAVATAASGTLATTSAIGALAAPGLVADSQALAAFSLISCGSRENRYVMRRANLLLAPIALGPEPEGFIWGNLLFQSAALVLSLLVVCVCWASRGAAGIRQGMVLAKFPSRFLGIGMIFHQGTAVLSARLLLDGRVSAPAILGAAVSAALPLSTFAMYKQQLRGDWTDPETLSFFRYESGAFDGWPRRQPFKWARQYLLPCGRWGPHEQRAMFGKPLNDVLPALTMFATVPLLQASLVAVVAAVDAHTLTGCLVQYGVLALMQISFAAAVAVLKPYRVPFINEAQAASHIVLAAYLALSAGIAFDSTLPGLHGTLGALLSVQALLTIARVVHSLFIMVGEKFFWAPFATTVLYNGLRDSKETRGAFWRAFGGDSCADVGAEAVELTHVGAQADESRSLDPTTPRNKNASRSLDGNAISMKPRRAAPRPQILDDAYLRSIL